MTTTIQVHGLDALKAQLDELGAVLAGKALAQAARKAFAPVLAAAQARAPVDTGLLRDSIKIAVQRPKNGDTVVVVGLKVAAAKGALKLGRKTLSPHWRWHFVELGTRNMAAKPFLRPALDSQAQAVVSSLTTELRASIDRAIRRKAKSK